MENPFTAHGKGQAFPTSCKQVSHSAAGTGSLAHSHNACGCENPSYPFLSGMEQTRNNIKKSGSTAIGRKLYSHCIYLYELFTLFSSSSGAGTTGGNASTSFRSASRLNNAINCSTNVSISSWCSLHQNANKIFWSPRAVSA